MKLPSQEQFVDIIAKLKETEEKNTKFGNMMEEFSGSWFCSELAYPATEALMTLLEIVFEDESEWISWWIYEKNYGSRADLEAYYKNGDVIKLDTAEELYDFLVQNMSQT